MDFLTNRDPGDEQAMGYAIKWQEFWWDEELERGYVSDYTSDQKASMSCVW